MTVDQYLAFPSSGVLSSSGSSPASSQEFTESQFLDLTMNYCVRMAR